MNEYRKPIWPKIVVTVFVLLPVLYAASIGPACWISSRINVGGRLIATIYYPLLWLSVRSPEPIGNFVGWYVRLGALEDWAWILSGDRSIEWAEG